MLFLVLKSFVLIHPSRAACFPSCTICARYSDPVKGVAAYCISANVLHSVMHRFYHNGILFLESHCYINLPNMVCSSFVMF